MLEKTYEILDVAAIDGNSKTCSWSTVASAVSPLIKICGDYWWPREELS